MIKLKWEVWPKSRGGSQDDPVIKVFYVETLLAAVSKANKLKIAHGENLRYVDITQRIVGE